MFRVGQKIQEKAINGVSGYKGTVVRANYFNKNPLFNKKMEYIDVLIEGYKKPFSCLACNWEDIK